jgi:hypothetical protein
VVPHPPPPPKGGGDDGGGEEDDDEEDSSAGGTGAGPGSGKNLWATLQTIPWWAYAIGILILGMVCAGVGRLLE